MDFQHLLNLLHGNLGGAGMLQAEDGSMVNGGYYDQASPQVPQLQETQETPQPPLDFQALLRSLLGQ